MVFSRGWLIWASVASAAWSTGASVAPAQRHLDEWRPDHDSKNWGALTLCSVCAQFERADPSGSQRHTWQHVEWWDGSPCGERHFHFYSTRNPRPFRLPIPATPRVPTDYASFRLTARTIPLR